MKRRKVCNKLQRSDSPALDRLQKANKTEGGQWPVGVAGHAVGVAERILRPVRVAVSQSSAKGIKKHFLWLKNFHFRISKSQEEE